MSYEDDCILYSEGKRDWIMVEYQGNAKQIVTVQRVFGK
jgi:hypothetical protein